MRCASWFRVIRNVKLFNDMSNLTQKCFHGATDTLRQDASKYFIHVHGASGEGQSPDNEGKDFRPHTAEP